MKNNYSIASLMLLLLFLVSGMTVALPDLDVEPTTDKLKVIIQLDYYSKSDNTPIVTVTVKRKENRKMIYLEGVLINFYLTEISRDGMMGSMMTGEDGKADFPLGDKFSNAKDTLSEYTFIARLNNDARYIDKDVSITIQEANIELSLFEEDSIKYANAVVTVSDSGNILLPVQELDVNFYVQRMFSLLRIGEYAFSTDEDGSVSIAFPEDIPGDTAGNIIIVVRIEDHEDYGNVEVRKTINWGAPLVKDEHLHNRSLWSTGSNAPMPLVFISLIIIIGVWGILAYLVIQLLRIRRLSKLASK